MKKKQFVCLALAAAMLGSMPGCTGSLKPENRSSAPETTEEATTTAPETTEESTAEPTEESETETSEAERVLHNLGEDYAFSISGVESEKDLYEHVMNYVRNGCDVNSLSEDVDRVLMLVYITKKNDGEREADNPIWQFNISRGMSMADTYRMLAAYKKRVTEMDPPFDEATKACVFTDEQFEELYEMYPKENFPNLGVTEEEFRAYLLDYLSHYMPFMDANLDLNIDTASIVWDKRGKLKAYEMTKLYKAHPDLEENFPPVYHMEITKGKQNNLTVTVDVEYTKIDDRVYYLKQNWYMDVEP